MPKNIEIKAYARDPEKLRKLAETISQSTGEVIFQEDTFFLTPNGRLKLRKFSPDDGVLVYYDRPNLVGPKTSDFILFPTTAPDMLKTTLAAALNVRGVVRKRRVLFLVENTRIHLDEVENLGNFIEFEVCLQPDQSNTDGEAIAASLMEYFELQREDLIPGAYVDMLDKDK